MAKKRLTKNEMRVLRFETEITINGDEGNFVGVNSVSNPLGYKLSDTKTVRLKSGDVIEIENMDWEREVEYFKETLQLNAVVMQGVASEDKD